MGRRRCCIERCPGDSTKMSLFLPPKRDKKICKKWLEAVSSHKKLAFHRYSYVCELHFKPEEIQRFYVTTLKDGTIHKIPRARTSLVPGAYPTLFNVNETQRKSVVRSKKSSDQTEIAPNFQKFVEYKAQRARSDLDEEATSNEEHEGISESGDSKIIRNHHNSLSDVSGEEGDAILDNMSDDCGEIVWHRNIESADDLISEINLESAAVSMNNHLVGQPASEDDEMFVDDDDSTIHRTDDENVDDGSTVKSADVYFDSSSTKYEPTSPGSEDANSDSQQSDDKVDLLSILNNRSSRLEIDDETFVRFCQRHIVTSLIKKGRMSFLDRVPPKRAESEDIEEDGLQVVHNVVGRHLKVDLLISRLDSLSYPSKSWFHTVKDGAPTFFCWNDGFRIDKTIILNAKNLEPTVIFVDKKVNIPEIVRPRSINDVQSILRLVDSAQECSRRNNPAFARNCKGFLIPKRGGPILNPLCSECALAEDHENRLSEEELTFDMVCRWAKEITKDMTTWSYTLLGTAVILIGWMKCYTIERLLVVNNDLSIKVIIGGKFVSTGLSLRNRKEFTLAIGFLEKCRKCFGIGESRFASDCLGFVVDKDSRLRVPKCQPCLEAKRKEVSRIKPSKPAKVQHVRNPGGDVQPLKISDSTDPKEISVIGAGEAETGDDTGKSVHLVDVLDCVSLPTDSWSCTVVDGSVVFQHWDFNYRIDKKVVVLPNTVILIYAEDNLVEIDSTIIEARSIFDVEQALILAENLHLCEGYGASLKAEGCLGYFIHPKPMENNRRCQRCSDADSQENVRTASNIPSICKT